VCLQGLTGWCIINGGSDVGSIDRDRLLTNAYVHTGVIQTAGNVCTFRLPKIAVVFPRGVA